MTSPKISVILPVYNEEKYLSQCLDSICVQTIHNIEILCIDDGSTDGSNELLQRYAVRDQRVRLFVQKNKGAGAARNLGIRHAKGEYYAFLDSDDFYEPEMLEKSLKSLEAYNSDFAVVGSDQYNEKTRTYWKDLSVVNENALPPYMPFKHRELTENVFRCFVGWAWDKVYRRSFIEKHDLWFQEQRTSNDLLFVFSALVLARKISVVNEILAHHRIGNTTALSVTREKSWHCFYDALIALKERLIMEGIYWELEQDFINYALYFSLWNLQTLAEPQKSRLREKLYGEWFSALGITTKNADYFYEHIEYEIFLRGNYAKQ